MKENGYHVAESGRLYADMSIDVYRLIRSLPVGDEEQCHVLGLYMDAQLVDDEEYESRQDKWKAFVDELLRIDLSILMES